MSSRRRGMHNKLSDVPKKIQGPFFFFFKE
jgi:hypothetical protein